MTDNSFLVSNHDAGQRLDVFAAKESGQTRAAVQKMIDGGLVLVNGKAVKASYKLSECEQVSVEYAEPVAVDIKPENIELNILYEDNDLIVIDKPKNFVVHPAHGHYTNTLVNALMYHCGDSLSGINGELRPGIVHRIDMDTSGVMVAAKSNSAHVGLAKQFAEHSINRIYYGVACGNIKEDAFTIDRPIGRHPVHRQKMAVVAAGRHAVTHIKVINRFVKKNTYSFIEARLETGRTHQIRVHLASIGHPLLGDKVYGSEKQPFGLDSQVLHAGVLGFIHPITGEYVEFWSELPEYFRALGVETQV